MKELTFLVAEELKIIYPEKEIHHQWMQYYAENVRTAKFKLE